MFQWDWNACQSDVGALWQVGSEADGMKIEGNNSYGTKSSLRRLPIRSIVDHLRCSYIGEIDA